MAGHTIGSHSYLLPLLSVVIPKSLPAAFCDSVLSSTDRVYVHLRTQRNCLRSELFIGFFPAFPCPQDPRVTDETREYDCPNSSMSSQGLQFSSFNRIDGRYQWDIVRSLSDVMQPPTEFSTCINGYLLTRGFQLCEGLSSLKFLFWLHFNIPSRILLLRNTFLFLHRLDSTLLNLHLYLSLLVLKSPLRGQHELRLIIYHV
ncbi:hypothetical protein DFS33DRAFT_529645 [Desarmillaria ectypa]|nr:hypothetical protein DFS33DRAFT_529645 [Desarmillaria ectypa]